MRFPRVHRAGSRLLVSLTAGFGLLLSAPGAARAETSYEIPAPTEGGVGMTATYYKAVVPQHYNPDPTAYFGPRKCLNTYHDYEPTPGCGGFKLKLDLHNVRNQPGFDLPPWLSGAKAPRNLPDNRFRAWADISRTFGCLRPDGSFEPGTKFVVRQTQQPLEADYVYNDAGYVLSMFRQGMEQYAGFYMPFQPVEVNCPAGTTPSQYGLKVSNLKVHVNASEVFGNTTWTHPGVFYA
ncbi:hypothetical protein [Streptomyces jumonjinensis]|uniref:hypothetical protein n=1 Tax=Streptomyces jumonjinensis TaxID=1945 RepID=UPI0037AE8C7A